MVRVPTVAAVVALTLAACSEGTAPDVALRVVALPDLSRIDPAAQQQLREVYGALQAIRQREDAATVDRARAFGRLGMLLHAAEYYEAAEPAYLNAQTLAPDEPRWPYYLGHVYKVRGDAKRSANSLARALQLRPDDVATLVWLGRHHLDQGEAAQAAVLFERARTHAPSSVAVLAGLGQAALAQRDFPRAVHVLEQALALDPGSASIHAPLAMAYRGLGNLEAADGHLANWKNTEILVPDPLRQELDLALESGLASELRGVRALEARDFAAAAGFFRQGVQMTPAARPLGRSLRHKLGTALYLVGDLPGAIEQFVAVLEAAPAEAPDETAAKAHYSLGVLMSAADRGDDAIRHLQEAARYSPNYVEAVQALADALRRSGRDAESLERYATVLRLDPRAGDARFGYAMALVRLRRHREAVDWLEEAMRRHPDRGDFKAAMARLLAASPDDSVRDGARAMTLVDQLLKGPKTVALGEATAMGLAELGRYEEAAAVQRQVMRAADEARVTVDTNWMAGNLRRYERGQPARTPWSDTDPVHRPGPPASLETRAALAGVSPAVGERSGLPRH